MTPEYEPYNPLNTANIAESLSRAVLAQTPIQLNKLTRFLGAGTYILYYTGEFEAYVNLTKLDQSGEPFLPIYVGKADPKGRRKGYTGSQVSDPLTYVPSTELFSRLTKHAASIEAAINLRIEDFKCRYLVIEPLYAALGESILINKYMPAWNGSLDGFGNNDPGNGRYLGLQPKWDVIHPGREWATKCKKRNETVEKITAEVTHYIKERVTTVT